MSQCPYVGIDMFDGITHERVLQMTDRERRWLHNIKKAFYASDVAYAGGTPQDTCLPELCKAIDTAKTLRRSLRGEDTSSKDNKRRFIDFLNIQIPDVASGGLQVQLVDARTKDKGSYSFAEILYAVRCMVHENENLDTAEQPDYHIQIDWSASPAGAIGVVNEDGRIVCSGRFLWHRLRCILAPFIMGIDGIMAAAHGEAFSILADPPLRSIHPD